MSKSEWVTFARDRLVVFPGSSFLRLPSDEFEKMGMPPLSDDEMLLFGLCGRMAKDGHSLAVSLPHSDKMFFVKLINYLHRVRMDALNGYTFGSHYQPDRLWKRNDLVWFGRPMQILGDLEKIKGIAPCRITPKTIKNREGFGGGRKIARTPLVPCTQNLTEVFDLLEEKSRPFTFIIDATATGARDSVKEVWEGLSVYFPGIPFIIVSTLGDLQTEGLLDRIPIHRWTYRIKDKHFWGAREAAIELPFPFTYETVEVPDNDLNSLLINVLPKIHNFKKQVANESKLIQQQSHSKAAKIYQFLSTLACPLSMREKALERRCRSGLYAIRPISREMEILSKVELRYGESANSCRLIHSDLQFIYDLIANGETGKSQALKTLLQDGKDRRNTTLILVSNDAEADAVINFIHNENIALVDDNLLSVKPTGNLKSILSINRRYSSVIILCKLWDRDLWWLGGIAKKVYWPCYPYELEATRRKLASWEDSYLKASRADGDKLRILRFLWPRNKFIKDQETVRDDSIISQLKLTNCTGDYPKDKTVVIEHNNDPIDWLHAIIAAEEPVENEDSAGPTGTTGQDTAKITLEETLTDIFWPIAMTVQVLNDSEEGLGVVRKSVEELEAGDQIILLQGSQTHGEILQALFDEFHESSDFSELARWSSYWTTIVDEATEKFSTPQKLLAALRKHGTTVAHETILNWKNKKVWGPVELLSVKNMALVAGNDLLAEHASKIHKAIKLIWAEHRRIGKDLHQALMSRAEGATIIKLGSRELDVELLDDILRIHTVYSVELPGGEPVYPKSMSDLVPRITKELGESLLLTGRAIRSMENSPYRDMEKVWSCFELMSQILPPFFKGEKRKDAVSGEFRQIGVEVRAGTSQLTQGKTGDYNVKYEGNTVDMGAHLCIGTAHNPTKTLRIHYHWDTDKSLLVIHHAGKHLKTRA